MGTSEMAFAVRRALPRIGMVQQRAFCRVAPGTLAPSAIKSATSAVNKVGAVDVAKRHELVDPVSGIPDAQLARKVFVFAPTQGALQSGYEKLGSWKIEFENPDRWRNPLMHWSSAADPMSNLKMKFPSKE